MTSDARARMIRSAVELLARQGLQATSFAEVIERSGAPRGSIYHHFPQGKTELVEAALDAAGAVAIDLLDQKAGAPADEVAAWFLHIWREVLVRSDLEAGCAVLAVTVAADPPELRDHAAGIFRTWRKRLAELLSAGGLTPADAEAMAATLIAGSEGAVAVSRAERSLEPFDLVADRLLADVRRLMTTGRRSRRASSTSRRRSTTSPDRG